MNTSAITEYFDLRKKQFEIDARLEALKPAVAEQLRKINGIAHLDGYDLKLSTFTAWEYSPKVNDLQRNLTETKKMERQEGVAKIKERRDMLVLKAHQAAGFVREESEAYGEWESEDTAPAP